MKYRINRIENPTSILLVKLRGIGDAVLLTPSIKVIKEKYPDADITLITSVNGGQILNKNPYINTIFAYDKKSFTIFDLIKLVYKTRKKKIDLAINFHASYRSALLVYLSGAKYRITHNHSGENYFSNIKITAKKEQKSIIERDFDCLRTIKIEPDSRETKVYLSEDEKKNAKKFLQNLLKTEELNFKIIGINPGVNRVAKRWQEEKFAELIDKIKKEYSKDEIRVLLFSGFGEEHIGEKIEKLTRTKVYMIRNTGLREVAGIISHCSLLIGNDNGLFHIAVGLDIPTITIFGPENPMEWHPYEHLSKDKHIVISKNLPCMNCGKMYCETHNCMDKITVDEVFKKFNQFVSIVKFIKE